MIENKVILLVGAMKSGTTSLYSDLALHPSVFSGGLKEPSILVVTEKDCVAVERAYQDYFASARQDQILLDGSTHYTMLPDNRGVPELASLVFRRQPLIIYLVREPFGRIRSHFQFQHILAKGTTNASFREALYSDRRLINYSSYFKQIKPWIDQFGLEQVRILTTDYWAANRSAVAKSVWRDLELERLDFSGDMFFDVKNKISQKRLSPVFVDIAKTLTGNRLWLYKKYLPKAVVQAAVSLLRSRPPTLVEASFEEEDFEMIWGSLVGEFQQLATIIKHPLEDPCTIWSKERLKAKYLGSLSS